jgi:hypothetical protein
MLSGTADVDLLAARVPTMARLTASPLQLGDAHVLQVMYETETATRQSLLPPGLHPTDPPIVNWLFYRCTTSPWGPFAMAQTRIECRSGLRLRAFLVAAVVDNAAAAHALRCDWGFTVHGGGVSLRRYYDTTHARVVVDGGAGLELTIADPEPLAASDIQYVPNMNLARAPNGLRLLQVEPRYQIARAERGRPLVRIFDGARWGVPELRPVHPVSASLVAADITVPPVRFLCRPDVWAFEGTEKV